MLGVTLSVTSLRVVDARQRVRPDYRTVLVPAATVCAERPFFVVTVERLLPGAAARIRTPHLGRPETRNPCLCA